MSLPQVFNVAVGFANVDADRTLLKDQDPRRHVYSLLLADTVISTAVSVVG